MLPETEGLGLEDPSRLSLAPFLSRVTETNCRHASGLGRVFTLYFAL